MPNGCDGFAHDGEMTTDPQDRRGGPLVTTKHHLRATSPGVPRDVVIAISDAGSPARKAAHLQLGSDGSIYFGSPYHPPSPGVVFKSRVPQLEDPHGTMLQIPDVRYRVEGPVKLSMHSSGFVQVSRALFARGHVRSSVRVRSGMDDAFWVAKGLGIHCPPVWQPIDAGPAFNLVMYGLDACRRWTPQQPKGTRSLVFEEGDIFEQDPHRPAFHAYVIECFILPPEARRDASYRQDKGWVVIAPYGTARPGLAFPLKVVDLPLPGVFLGVLVSRTHIEAVQPGYFMKSQMDLNNEFFIGAAYPAANNGGDDLGLPRLNP
jgi:hypothetical protein